MLLADQYEIDLSEPLGEVVAKLFPNPDELHRNTLLVPWHEESVLDKAMGIFWPAHFSAYITDAYQKRGKTLTGFKASITFTGTDGCLVTFTKID